jgi:hypothetical protein
MIQNWAGVRVFGIILEYAAGGDLFDKIGSCFRALASATAIRMNPKWPFYSAPDFGVSEVLAHYFFRQLISGLVSSPNPVPQRDGELVS